ncbi:hypothetical protein OTB20_25325 [Streptomyces sp. H27-H1]|uniref:hypothetical protein n=1 Tax=unclassified Streptomyces TaxID=2593676 RepID=UPI002270B81F|nr:MULTISPECIES: hypothetical protein [unclassified Streptomyces]MCY0929461.1 hypothetical protein [Streptomyces sp. H27-H1]MCY0938323.1 hypothetical protein [Streptomyces sp. H34-S4]
MESGADSKRVRVEIDSRDKYGIMWLAGIRQIDLTQHCLKTFAECDRPKVDRRLKQQTLLLPADSPPVAWYLCALPIPWQWSRNAHLAFEHAPGETWEGDALVPGLGVRLTNARPITGWGEHSIPAKAPMRQARLYRTCRNWQFGWWLRQHREAPDAPEKPHRQESGGDSEQLTFQ